jgi:hypothetical protein
VRYGRALTWRRPVLRSALKLLNGLYLFGGEYNNEALSDLYVFNPGTLKIVFLLASLLLIQ